MINVFFDGWATMLELQQNVLNSALKRTTPSSANFGRMPNGPQIEIGSTAEQVIPLAKEELRIGKRQQSAKAYRLNAKVVEVAVEEQVKLRAETVIIERRPASGTTIVGGEAFENRTIEVYEIYEEPVIGKVVTQGEEMVVYKTLSERTAVVRDTVREMRVDVAEQEPSEARPEITAEFEAEFRAAADDEPGRLERAEHEHDREARPETTAEFREAAGDKPRGIEAEESEEDVGHASDDAPDGGDHDDSKSRAFSPRLEST
jgi:stress response protein YsnF